MSLCSQTDSVSSTWNHFKFVEFGRVRIVPFVYIWSFLRNTQFIIKKMFGIVMVFLAVLYLLLYDVIDERRRKSGLIIYWDTLNISHYLSIFIYCMKLEVALWMFFELQFFRKNKICTSFTTPTQTVTLNSI